jgi:parvulin-like peptidyl-prolyl isomerase
VSVPSIAFAIGLVSIAACSGSPGRPARSGPAGSEPPPPALQSNSILARDARTSYAVVRHVLIGWRDLEGGHSGAMDPRAQARSRGQADELIEQIYRRAVGGESFTSLMAEFSEDPGSAQSGATYEVEPGGPFVFEFRRLALRLDVGETGKVLSQFGWHVIQRFE